VNRAILFLFLASSITFRAESVVQIGRQLVHKGVRYPFRGDLTVDLIDKFYGNAE